MRHCSKISALLLTSVMQTGCIEAAFQEGVALAPTDTGTSTSSTSEPGTPTTSASDGGGGPGVQTVTGAEESSNPVGDTSSTADETSASAETSVGDSTGTPVNAPPEVGLFADPPQLNEAGASEIKLTASADVVLARLRLNGEQIFEGPPAKFPFVYEALSAKYNFPHHFEVEAEDAEGLKDTATTDLVVQLPQPGAEKCLFKDAGALASGINALVYTDKAIYAVGARDSGSGLELTVWALDPDHCEIVLPGWPKTIAGWTGEPDLGVPMSGGVAVAVDEIGNLAIGGNLIVNGTTQPYVALLTSDGGRLWERTGSVGSELAGLAAFTGQYSDRVVGVGWRRTNQNPVRTDAQIWTYQPADDNWVILTEHTLKAPFLPGEKLDDLNQRSEWARAVLVKDGVAFIVGEREFEDGEQVLRNRAFMAKLHPIGPVEPLWTSWGVHSINDAARSLAVCGEQMVTGGWDRDEPANAKPEPLIVWFDEDGAFAGSRPDALAWTQTNGIACDREGKIVSGGVRLSGDGDGQVFTVPGQVGQRTWYEMGVAGPDAVGAVACDPRGFCAGGGWRTVNGKFYAAVRVFHP
jgi:hypothetical protein